MIRRTTSIAATVALLASAACAAAAASDATVHRDGATLANTTKGGLALQGDASRGVITKRSVSWKGAVHVALPAKSSHRRKIGDLRLGLAPEGAKLDGSEDNVYPAPRSESLTVYLPANAHGRSVALEVDNDEVSARLTLGSSPRLSFSELPGSVTDLKFSSAGATGNKLFRWNEDCSAPHRTLTTTLRTSLSTGDTITRVQHDGWLCRGQVH